MMKIYCYKCGKAFEVVTYGYADSTHSKQTAVKPKTIVARCPHCETANTYTEPIQPTTSPYRSGAWAFLLSLFH
jgi:hypothetical protein